MCLAKETSINKTLKFSPIGLAFNVAFGAYYLVFEIVSIHKKLCLIAELFVLREGKPLPYGSH